MAVRKSVAQLSGPEVTRLRRAFTTAYGISDDRGYQTWAGYHGLPLPAYCHHGRPPGADPLFLPWHRAYLYFFEKSLQDQTPGVTVPWWDWTSAGSHRSGLPAPFQTSGRTANSLVSAPVTAVLQLDRDALRARGLLGGSSTQSRTVRDPGAPDDLPRQSTIQSILNAPTFYDFTARIENVHNDVHGWTGGSMTQITVAAYDPVFWSHHSMIDRLWYLWQVRHPTQVLPSSFTSRALPPFPITVGQTLDISRLGYEYAVQVVG